MLREFFLDKFEFDYQVNRTWCAHLLLHEDSINYFINRQMSHMINVHHIWLCRLLSEKPESNEWDVFSPNFWEQLLEENYRRTQLYMQHFGEETKINFHDSEGESMERTDADILYHILNHSQYHRAQIAHELRLLELPVPSMQFIQYH